MPKFNGQNKKRIDPRYFLNETTNRDENIEEITMGSEMYGDDLQHQHGQHKAFIAKIKDEVEKTLQMMLDDGRASGLENEFADVVDGMMAGKLSDKQIEDLDDAINPKRGGSPEKLKSMVKALGSQYRNKGADSNLSNIDRDRDGKISADQLANIATAIKKNQA